MSNKLLLAVIAASLITGVIGGIAVKSALTKNPVSIPAEIRTEIAVRKIPVRIKEIKYVEKIVPATEGSAAIPPFVFADSLAGVKDSIEYEVIHRVDNSRAPVISNWDIKINSLLKEYVKEKLIVELKEVQVAEPFYNDGWFWSTFIAIPLLVLAIIF